MMKARRLPSGDHAKSLTPLLKSIAGQMPKSVVLINNAGVHGTCGPIGQMEEGEVIEAFQVNLLGAVFLSNVFVSIFSDFSFAKRIINISSGAATDARPGGSAYCQTKSGLEILTRHIALEQKDKAFPVESIAIRPGRLDTPMLKELKNLIAKPQFQLLQNYFKGAIPKDPVKVAIEIVETLADKPIESGKTYTL
jgi:benzil reductase ((S)-benzoin forming)